MLRRLFGLARSGAPGYETIEPIARGAFSTVYRARAEDGKEVALKVLNEEGAKLARKLMKAKDTLWEGELLASLDHPHIVKVFDYGYEKKPHFIAMELLENCTREYISCSKSLGEVQKKIDIIVQVGRALDYLHGKGYLHRDLCAGNVMVGSNGDVRLIDFGLAAHMDADLVQDWKAGTPSYMAPELIRTNKSSVLTDIYSLGVILYEFVTGVKPVKADYQYERMMRNLSAPVAPPSRHCEHVPPEVDEVVMKAIAKDPAERYQTADEFVRALVRVAIGAEPQIMLLPSSVEDGAVIETPEVSLMAWAFSPVGIQAVEFQFRVAGGKWKRIGDRVTARPGRENMFGVDWDVTRLPTGARVALRALAVDNSDRVVASDRVKVKVGRIKSPAE